MNLEARSIAGLHLSRRLGAGGAAEVWEAIRPGHPDQPVAVKLLRGAENLDGAGQRRFLAEARIVALLDHPNIVRGLEAGVEDGRAFLVMELLHGSTLAELAGSGRQLPVGLVIALGRQLMNALDHAHRVLGPDGQPLQLVHRDIKPSNLFVTTNGVLKVIDFGIAAAAWRDRSVTATGVLRGSLPYVSPEQAQGRTVDQRTDLFSSGLVLHELLTGRRVFDQESESAILTAILFAPLPSVRSRRPDVPRDLADLIASMTARLPDDRPHTAAEVARALESMAPSEPWSEKDIAKWMTTQERRVPSGSFPTPTLDAQPVLPVLSAPGSTKSVRWHRVARNPWLLAGLGGLILLVGGGLVRERLRGRPAAIRSLVAPPPGDRQPAFPVRAAFYYPPFRRPPFHRPTNYHPATAHAKTLDEVLARDRAGLAYGKFQVAILSWTGRDTDKDRVLRAQLAGSVGAPLRWSVYFEREGYANPSSPEIAENLRYLGDNYGADPSYYRIDGRFVVFVFHDAADRCESLDRWLDANTIGAYLVMFAFPGYEQCARPPDAWHDYAANAFHELAPHSVSISPGAWSMKVEAPRLARDLDRFRADVRRMNASPARFRLVVTFNEWVAGTAVDGADEWASPSGFGSYLDALHDDGR